MNSYQIFELGDIVRLQDDLTIADFLWVKSDYLNSYAGRNLVQHILELVLYTNNGRVGGSYVSIESILDEKHFLIKIVESNNSIYVNEYLCASINFIDKDVLRMMFVERNSKKRVRRHDNRIKNNQYGKSKFFHKDKFERK